MATARSPTKTWVAREGEMYIDRSGNVTVGAATTLSGCFVATGASVHAACKNITVTPPETGWEKVDFQGETISGFQNQLLDEKPVSNATLTATLILGNDEVIEDYMVSGTVTGTAGYTRYQVGKNNTNILTVCVDVSTSNDSDYKAALFDNARVTKWGDVRVGSADGHWEQDFTLICLAKDFYYEVKD